MAFEMLRRLFYHLSWHFLTLDDKLMGTHSKDNLVRALCTRKADRDAHISNVLEHAIFCFILTLGIHHQGEGVKDAVRMLSCNITDSRWEFSSRLVVPTADCSYRKPRIKNIIRESGLSSIFIMPEHVIIMHPVIASSQLGSEERICRLSYLRTGLPARVLVDRILTV